jgi:putative phosphoesterase
MRIGLISDVHGNAPALEAALTECEALGVRRLLVAGDVVGYYPFVNEVIGLLREWNCAVVLGNHDAYLLGLLPCSDARWRACCLDFVDRVIAPDNRQWLASQPPTQTLELDGRRVFLCHATPGDMEAYANPDVDDWAAFAEVEADVVVFGHTHIPLIRHVPPRLFVNPGSSGQPRDSDSRASYAVLDTEQWTVENHRVSYDIERVQRAVRAEGLPEAVANALSRLRYQVP